MDARNCMDQINSHPPAVQAKYDRGSLDLLADIFRAFGDPTRLALLRELLAGSKTVNELFTAVGTTQANISRQLKLLYKAGLLHRKQKGLFVSYSIADPLVLEICNVACRKVNQTAIQHVPEFII